MRFQGPVCAACQESALVLTCCCPSKHHAGPALALSWCASPWLLTSSLQTYIQAAFWQQPGRPEVALKAAGILWCLCCLVLTLARQRQALGCILVSCLGVPVRGLGTPVYGLQAVASSPGCCLRSPVRNLGTPIISHQHAVCAHQCGASCPRSAHTNYQSQACGLQYAVCAHPCALYILRAPVCPHLSVVWLRGPNSATPSPHTLVPRWSSRAPLP